MIDKIVNSIQSTNSLWDEIKKDWFILGLPGFASSPTELLVRLLLIKLGINSAAELKQVLSSISDEDIKDLSQSQLIPGYWSASDVNTVFLLKLILSGKEGNIMPGVAEYIARESEEQLDGPISEFTISVDQPEVEEASIIDEVIDIEEGLGLNSEASEDVEESGQVAEPQKPSVGCKHVDEAGNCIDCSNKDFFDCTSCKEATPQSKLTDCATGEDDCSNTYCQDCVEENINKYGFCPDCEVFDCESCSTEVTNGEEFKCASESSDCDHSFICADCAARYLNDNKECPTCSGEEVSTCSECPSGEDEFTESKVIDCVNVDDCGYGYCTAHSADFLNSEGKCRDCVEKEKSEAEVAETMK